MSNDPETIEFFARLAYASQLLVPGVDMDKAPKYDALPPAEKQRLRDAMRRELESAEWIDAFNETLPTPATAATGSSEGGK